MNAFSNVFRIPLLVVASLLPASCVHPAPVMPAPTATDALANVPIGAPILWTVPVVEVPSLEAEVETAVLRARGATWGGPLSARWKQRPAIEYYEDPLFESAAFSATSALHVPPDMSITVSRFRIFREVAYYDVASHRIIARNTIRDPRWVLPAIKHSFARAVATALAWDEHGAVVDNDDDDAIARYGQALRFAEGSRTAEAAFPSGAGRVSLRDFGRLPSPKSAGTRRGDVEDLIGLTWGPKAATYKGAESSLTDALFDDFLRREAGRLLAAPRDAADERSLYADPPRTLTTALDRAAWSTPPKTKMTAKDGWTVSSFHDGSYETALALALGTLDEDSVFRCARAVRGVYYAEMPVKAGGQPKDGASARPGARCYVYSADSVGEAAGRCLQRTLEGLGWTPASWSTPSARIVCSDVPNGFAAVAEQALTVSASPSDPTAPLVLPPPPASDQGWIPVPGETADRRTPRAALRPPGGLPASFTEGKWSTGGHTTNVLFRKEPLDEALARAAGIAEIFDSQLGESDETKKETKQAMHGYPAVPTVLRDQLVAFGRPLPAARLRRSWLATGRRLDVWVTPFDGAMLTVIVRHAAENETDDRPEIGNPNAAGIAPQGRP
jgi:hypothetical protein